jgi:ribose 5-phosphate isomerase A
MTQDELKRQVAQAAIEYVKGEAIIGVGTGSTVNFFIDLLEPIKYQIEAAVSSSIVTTKRLENLGIPVIELSEVDRIGVYVDGADEVNPQKKMIKGGGGALTREKIVAAVSDKFVCIVDDSKCVDVMGQFPLPIEVIPMARSYVARELVIMGGQPVWRENYRTDNDCDIIDIHNLNIMEPMTLEKTLNNIPGVVTVGLFALRDADVVLVGKGHEVITY